eukprot:8409179-Ditylum_brightwellii.AAC.1
MAVWMYSLFGVTPLSIGYQERVLRQTTHVLACAVDPEGETGRRLRVTWRDPDNVRGPCGPSAHLTQHTLAQDVRT